MAHDRDALERTVGGLRCGEVLARLSDYVDDELARDERHQVEEHLRGCDVCTRFGGSYSELVRSLREKLMSPPPANDVRERLRRRLEAER